MSKPNAFPSWPQPQKIREDFMIASKQPFLRILHEDAGIIASGILGELRFIRSN